MWSPQTQQETKVILYASSCPHFDFFRAKMGQGWGFPLDTYKSPFGSNRKSTKIQKITGSG